MKCYECQYLFRFFCEGCNDNHSYCKHLETKSLNGWDKHICGKDLGNIDESAPVPEWCPMEKKNDLQET